MHLTIAPAAFQRLQGFTIVIKVGNAAKGLAFWTWHREQCRHQHDKFDAGGLLRAASQIDYRARKSGSVPLFMLPAADASGVPRPPPV